MFATQQKDPLSSVYESIQPDSNYHQSLQNINENINDIIIGNLINRISVLETNINTLMTENIHNESISRRIYDIMVNIKEIKNIIHG